MARTDDDKVKAVMLPGGDYDTTRNPALDRFIQQANLLTSRMVTCATAKGFTHTSDELIEIETLLAAHFYQQSDKGYTSRSTNKASGSFHGQWFKGLDNTNYGQAAQSLDGSGCLSGFKNRLGLFWLGLKPSEQTDWVDRD